MGFPHEGRRAFTLMELLAAIGIMAILFALLVPALKRTKHRASELVCVSQLRQIGVGAIAFAGENEDKFPAATMPNTNRFLNPLQPLLWERITPRIFLCPTDMGRIVTPDMNLLNRSNTSYFVSYSASTDQPGAIVAGDRNITWDGALNTGANQFKRSYRFGWWRDMHHWRGNLLLSDGSVHTTTMKQLATHIGQQPAETFDWYIPNGDAVFTPAE
jgi:prepilin-type N-terminal cleavage/methylation domain-containing protein